MKEERNIPSDNLDSLRVAVRKVLGKEGHISVGKLFLENKLRTPVERKLITLQADYQTKKELEKKKIKRIRNDGFTSEVFIDFLKSNLTDKDVGHWDILEDCLISKGAAFSFLNKNKNQAYKVADFFAVLVGADGWEDFNKKKEHKELHQSPKGNQFDEIVDTLIASLEKFDKLSKIPKQIEIKKRRLLIDILIKEDLEQDLQDISSMKNLDHLESFFNKIVEVDTFKEGRNGSLKVRIEQAISDRTLKYQWYHKSTISAALAVSAIRNYCDKKIAFLLLLLKNENNQIKEITFMGLLLISVSIKNNQQRTFLLDAIFDSLKRKSQYKKIAIEFIHVICGHSFESQFNKLVKDINFSVFIPFSPVCELSKTKIDNINNRLDISNILTYLENSYFLISDSSKYRYFSLVESIVDDLQQEELEKHLQIFKQNSQSFKNSNSINHFKSRFYFNNVFLLLKQMGQPTLIKPNEGDITFFTSILKSPFGITYYYSRNQYDKVINDFNFNKYNHIDQLFMLTVSLFQLKRLAESQKIIKRILAKKSTQYFTVDGWMKWYILGKVAIHSEDYATTKKCFDMTFENNPKDNNILSEIMLFNVIEVKDLDIATKVAKRIIETIQESEEINTALLSSIFAYVLLCHDNDMQIETQVKKIYNSNPKSDLAKLYAAISLFTYYLNAFDFYNALDIVKTIEQNPKINHIIKRFLTEAKLSILLSQHKYEDAIEFSLKNKMGKLHLFYTTCKFFLENNITDPVESRLTEHKEFHNTMEYDIIQGIFAYKRKKYELAIDFLLGTLEEYRFVDLEKMGYSKVLPQRKMYLAEIYVYLTKAFLYNQNISDAKRLITMSTGQVGNEIKLLLRILLVIIEVIPDIKEGKNNKSKNIFKLKVTEVITAQLKYYSNEHVKQFVYYCVNNLKYDSDWLSLYGISQNLKVELINTLEKHT